MHAAIERRDLGALRSLDPKPQLVLDCARLAWTDGLASLAERGGDLNSLWRGYRPLHAAIQEDAHAGCEASVERLRCIEWLLAHGADPGLTGAWPPARASLVAAFTGVREFVDVLPKPDDIFARAALGDGKAVARWLKKDRTLSQARDAGGLTALQCAAASRMQPRGRSLECAKLLIEAGADLSAKTKSWSHEIDAAYLSVNGQHLEMFELLLERGADATASLPSAAWQSDLRFASLALAYGADVNKARDDRRPLLNNLIRWGRFTPAEWLLRHGADPNNADAHGWTALHQAARRGSKRMVQLLLSAGADPAAADADGATPHDVATKQDVRALLSR